MQYSIIVTQNGYILEQTYTDRAKVGKQWVFTTSYDLQQHLFNEHQL